MAELVSKNSFFNFNEKTLKEKRRIALGTKFAPAYSILFMEDLEEKSLEKVYDKPYLRWRHLLLSANMGKKTRPTIKFIVERS